MYEDGEQEIKSILTLVDLCPDPFKQTAFELLLQGYVNSRAPGRPSGPTAPAIQQPPVKEGQTAAGPTAIPAESLTRFKNTARRLDISLEALEALFDFS